MESGIGIRSHPRKVPLKRRYSSFPLNVFLVRVSLAHQTTYKQMEYHLDVFIWMQSAVGIFIVFVILGTAQRKHRESRDAGAGRIDTGQPTLFTFTVVKEFDHDPNAFTQGFEIYRSDQTDKGATFIESTGLRGKSTVREVDIGTGEVLRSTQLAQRDFGEGITRLDKNLYQLTWQSPRLISYDVNDFSKQQVHKTPLKDGWGITNDGTNLIIGDSTHILYYINPKSMKIMHKIEVKDGDKPVVWLNELEWVDGLIYANVWQTECIAQIEPNTGNVVGWIDLSGITDRVKLHIQDSTHPRQHIDVLNGIAWDGQDGALYITGKLWPKVYQIELRPLYLDSKTSDVKEMTESVRKRCIASHSLPL